MALPCLRLGTDRPQEQRRQVHHPTKLANTLPAGPSNAFPLSQNSLPPRLAACTTASFLRKTWMATSPRNGFRWQTCSVASEYKVQRNEHTRANDDAMVFLSCRPQGSGTLQPQQHVLDANRPKASDLL